MDAYLPDQGGPRAEQVFNYGDQVIQYIKGMKTKVTDDAEVAVDGLDNEVEKSYDSTDQMNEAIENALETLEDVAGNVESYVHFNYKLEHTFLTSIFEQSNNCFLTFRKSCSENSVIFSAKS